MLFLAFLTCLCFCKADVILSVLEEEVTLLEDDYLFDDFLDLLGIYLNE
jgi:hypothetical protein